MLKTRRRVVHRVRRTRRKQGAGFMDALRSAHNWIKSNKIISGVSGLLSKVGVPYAGAINSASSALGYGRKRRVGRPRARRVTVRRRPLTRRRLLTRRRRVGGSLRSMLSAAHGFIKKNQLVSKGLSHFGQTKLASAANALGYGRRRRVTMRRRRVGGSLRSAFASAHNFIKSNKLVSKGLSHFGQTKLASAANALGYGRRRRPVRRAVRHCGGANYFTESQLAVPRN